MSDVQGMTVALHAADEHTLGAYRAGPDDAARGLVVVQEIFGVNRHMRAVCDRFGSLGFAVVCPALFDRVQREVELGYGPDDVKTGIALRAQVPEAGTIADTTATWHPLDGVYRALRADGTLGAEITGISLRNGEGAILIRVR